MIVRLASESFRVRRSPIILSSDKCLNPRTKGTSFILSGGADGDVRFWSATKVSQLSNAPISWGSGNPDAEEEAGRYECQRRLTGHYRSTTCVSYGRLEVVSGHEDGKRVPNVFPFTIINALFLSWRSLVRNVRATLEQTIGCLW